MQAATSAQKAIGGLVTHRYDEGTPRIALRPRDGLVSRACLYTVADDGMPNRLAWYETADYVSPDQTRDWTAGAEGAELMSFRLFRSVENAVGTLDDCRWLYVVHTDIPEDVSREYNTWYDEEHLPRLVTVPGVIRARRYVSPDQAPHYLTAYDLADRDAFTSPEGLKARKTAWTERMRGLFYNTRRYTGVLQTPA